MLMVYHYARCFMSGTDLANTPEQLWWQPNRAQIGSLSAGERLMRARRLLVCAASMRTADHERWPPRKLAQILYHPDIFLARGAYILFGIALHRECALDPAISLRLGKDRFWHYGYRPAVSCK